jgi:signal transduction histidine kinase
LFLFLGVLTGAALALLAGLAVARRAMAPIAELTDTARRIERTRDPSLHMPDQAASDEVAELADTLEEMLRSLDASRSETEGALSRQRQFVADASHELRTPLTAVLANLELLEEELSGEQRDTAAAALRSTRRMRRLVADLLLLARADAGRETPHVPVDLAEVLVDAAAELEPVAGEHQLTVSAVPGAVVEGARDELHRLALNLMDNALKHTEPGTPIHATVERSGDDVVLVVSDEGPGVPKDIAPRIFDRFVRGASDRGGSSGLGLSIVRAVAETHGGDVTLEPSDSGARFVVRLPARMRESALSAEVVRT